MRLFVHAQHQRMFRRVQIKPHHVGGLAGETGIGRDAPRVTPLQRNSMLAQHPPNLIVGDVLQRRGQQGSVPTRITLGRRLIQLRQDATFAVAIVGRRLARSRRILQAVDPVAQKPAPPLAGRSRPRIHGRGDLLIAGPGGGAQNHPGTKHIPRRTGRAPH